MANGNAGTRAVRSGVIATVLLIAVWIVAVAGPWSPPALRQAVAEWGRLPFMLAAALIGWRAAAAQTLNPRARAAWRLLALACATMVVGDLLWGALSLIKGDDAQPSIADLFVLAYAPLALAGLLALTPIRFGRHEALGFALDAAIVAVASALVIWHLLVAPQLALGSTGDPIKPLLMVAYGVSDGLCVLGVAIVVGRVHAASARAPLALLAASLLANLAGDVLYAAVALGSDTILVRAAQLLWMFWGAFAFLAALVAWVRAPMPAASADTARPAAAFRHLPAIALVLLYVLLAPAAAADPENATGILQGGALVVLLIALRLIHAQRENERLRAAELAHAGADRVAALVERSSEAVFIVGPDLELRYASPAAALLLDGLPSALSLSVDARLHPDDRVALRDYVGACASGQLRHASVVLRFGAAPGPWQICECTLSNLLGDAAVDGIVINARDVSERHALQEQLRAQALRDPLTDLPNRVLFFDRAARALARADSGGQGIALAVVDLDRFKLVNDALGHRVGDQVLQVAARRIGAAIARSDSVARVGGDEFGLLLEDLRDEADLRARLERVRAALADALAIEGRAVRLSASIGAASAAGVGDSETLMRNADIALQHVRHEGGDGIELFRSDRHGRVVERLQVEAELPRMLEEGAFQLAFEPILKTDGGTPVGLYVRLGWRDPARAPESIRPVLSALGDSAVSAALGRWFLGAFESDLRALLRCLPEAATLSIHVSVDGLQLRDDDVIRRIAGALQRLDLPARQLVMEIQEGSLSPVTGPLLHAMHRLRALGLSVGLGRFGAAQANFDLFDAFPFDSLALASSLVARLDAGDRPTTLVRAVIATGRSMGMQVLAPGVRSARQLALLRELGCEQVAGEFLARPLRFEQLLPWLGGRYAQAAVGGGRDVIAG